MTLQINQTGMRRYADIHTLFMKPPNIPVQIFDDEITAKWREEATGYADFDVSEKMVDYALEELKCKTKLFKRAVYFSYLSHNVAAKQRYSSRRGEGYLLYTV